MPQRVAIIGGGAAGVFAAIRLKSLSPELDVTILERQSRVLKKVEISGGGRCNCTNTFEQIRELAQAYPRGHRVLKRLFRQWGPKDTYAWFERHGVPLCVEPDGCVFPQAQDSHAIIDCFMAECRKLGVHIQTGVDGFAVAMPDGLMAYDYVVITTGGMSPSMRRNFATDDIVPPLPSLFTFSIEEPALRSLMGIVTDATASIPGTKLRASGPLLITHWGVSGPAIIKLSSYAARVLAENNYRMPLAINWCGKATVQDIREALEQNSDLCSARLVANVRPFGLTSRLWEYLTQRAGIACNEKRWGDVGPRQLNKLTEVLSNDQYAIAGRSAYKDEFVTCGGISLDAVDRSTLESRSTPGLYFAGEVLDIDGITGGFNLQAAWTTADAVARAIADKAADGTPA